MTTIASLLLTTAPGAMLPGAAAPATAGVGAATGDFLKLVLPGCGNGIAAGVGAAGGRQELAGSGTGLPLVHADAAVMPGGEDALAWLADATGVEVPPAPNAIDVPATPTVAKRPTGTVSTASVVPMPILSETPVPAIGAPHPRARIAPPEAPVQLPFVDSVDAPSLKGGRSEEPTVANRVAEATPVDVGPVDAAVPNITPTLTAAAAAPAPTSRNETLNVVQTHVLAPVSSGRRDSLATPLVTTGAPVAKVNAPANDAIVAEGSPSPVAAPLAGEAPVASVPTDIDAPSPVPSSHSEIHSDPEARRAVFGRGAATITTDVATATKPSSSAVADGDAPSRNAAPIERTPSLVQAPLGTEPRRADAPVERAGAKTAARVDPAPRVGTNPRVDRAARFDAPADSASLSNLPADAVPVALDLSRDDAAALVRSSVAPMARSVGDDPAGSASTGKARPEGLVQQTLRKIDAAPAIGDDTSPTASAPAVTVAPMSAVPAHEPAVPVAIAPRADMEPRVRATAPNAPARGTPTIAAPHDMASPVIASAAAVSVSAPVTAPAASPVAPVAVPQPTVNATAEPVAPPIAAPAGGDVMPVAVPIKDGATAVDPTVEGAPPRANALVAPAVPRAQPEPAATPVIATAARTFAEAIHRAVSGDDRARPADPAAPVTQPQATAAISPAAVTATGQAQQQTLDMRQQHWPSAMIQHIEKLRDMADANDMRIRVVPDALGAIDVALRREGDTVQVQLTAEQPQTRQMLAEAQPRLTEMAEARGLKLQHSGAGAGSTTPQGDRPPQQQQQRAAPLPPAPPSARRAVAAETDDIDQRIA